LAEIATISFGLAAKAPENAEPSDIDTVKVATVVPETELSGSEAAVGTKVMPVGFGRSGGSPATTVRLKFADPLNGV